MFLQYHDLTNENILLIKKKKKKKTSMEEIHNC